MSKEDYNQTVLNEGGYLVELSNEGELKKHNPNYYNPGKLSIKCVAPSCSKMTTSLYSRCSLHKKLKDCPLHEKDWLGRTIPPGKSRTDFKTFALPHSEISKTLVKWIDGDKQRGLKMDSFIDDIIEKIHGKIPDATTLQKIYTGESKLKAMSPKDLVDITLELLENHFPKKDYANVILEGGKFKGTLLTKIPLRIVLVNEILAFACEESNRGDSWETKRLGIKQSYANMFMPLAIYLLLRKGASESEAKMSVRG